MVTATGSSRSRPDIEDPDQAVVDPGETCGRVRRVLERYDEPSGKSWPPKKRATGPR